MRVLITGASGFLGKRVVAAVAERGHETTALVRPSREAPERLFPTGVRVARADLRVAESIAPALEGIDAVVHLAACVVGDDDSQFASTVVGTENLLRAMCEAGVRRMVHCSTFSVYDWRRARSPLTEESPLEADLYPRDGYAISKSWQERLVRRHCESQEVGLTVLRPGFIWGPGAEEISGIGHALGPLRIVFGGARSLPLTYVENCAAAFAAVLDAPGAVGETFNVVDEPKVSAWRHQGRCLRQVERPAGRRGWRLYTPYWFGLMAARLATWTSKAIYRGKGKLPGILVPCRYRARFRPLRFATQKLRGVIGPHERFTYDEAWRHALEQPAGPPSEAPTAAPTDDRLTGDKHSQPAQRGEGVAS